MITPIRFFTQTHTRIHTHADRQRFTSPFTHTDKDTFVPTKADAFINKEVTTLYAGCCPLPYRPHSTRIPHLNPRTYHYSSDVRLATHLPYIYVVDASTRPGRCLLLSVSNDTRSIDCQNTGGEGGFSFNFYPPPTPFHNLTFTLTLCVRLNQAKGGGGRKAQNLL